MTTALTTSIYSLLLRVLYVSSVVQYTLCVCQPSLLGLRYKLVVPIIFFYIDDFGWDGI
jgi:hypothetical protein